jgi:hypothetical protein
MKSENANGVVRLASIVLAVIAAAMLVGAYLGLGSQAELLGFTWWFLGGATVTRYLVPFFILRKKS